MQLRSFVALFLLAIPTIALARSGGPPPNRVHLCDPGTNCAGGTNPGASCNGCHAAGLPFNASLDLQIRNALMMVVDPATTPYQPGADYDFLITAITDPLSACTHPDRPGTCTVPANRCQFGFQMTAVPDASCAVTPAPAGTFTVTDAVNTQIVTGSGLEFIEHTQCGTIAEISVAGQRRTWDFRWTAPPPGAGTTHFFWAVNAADADGTNRGDRFCYQDFLWREEAARPVLAMSTKDDAIPLGMPVSVGAPLSYTIVVRNTGTANADGVQVFDTLDDRCLDLSNFDASDVTVTPGPAVVDWSPPLLTLDFANPIVPGPAGNQQITIADLRAGTATAACCNQAIIREMNSTSGDLTIDAEVGSGPTCAEFVASAACDLERQEVSFPPVTPAYSAVYVNVCSAVDVRVDNIDPAVVSTPLGTAADTLDDAAPATGGTLRVYQLDCSCGADIALTKNAISGKVRLDFR